MLAKSVAFQEDPHQRDRWPLRAYEQLRAVRNDASAEVAPIGFPNSCDKPTL